MAISKDLRVTYLKKSINGNERVSKRYKDCYEQYGELHCQVGREIVTESTGDFRQPSAFGRGIGQIAGFGGSNESASVAPSRTRPLPSACGRFESLCRALHNDSYVEFTIMLSSPPNFLARTQQPRNLPLTDRPELYIKVNST